MTCFQLKWRHKYISTNNIIIIICSQELSRNSSCSAFKIIIIYYSNTCFEIEQLSVIHGLTKSLSFTLYPLATFPKIPCTYLYKHVYILKSHGLLLRMLFLVIQLIIQFPNFQFWTQNYNTTFTNRKFYISYCICHHLDYNYHKYKAKSYLKILLNICQLVVFNLLRYTCCICGIMCYWYIAPNNISFEFFKKIRSKHEQDIM